MPGFNFKIAKFDQVKKHLEQTVALVNDVVYYLKPVSISVLIRCLNLDWEQQKKGVANLLSSKTSLTTELSEEQMQRVILHLGYDFQNVANFHFYEQVQLLLFSHLVNVWQTRSLVVTVMGHIDHGKTTLLDVVQTSNLVSQEHGKITQKIGGYQICFQGEKITFIDTPGHQLFSVVRSQGVDITDLVVLVVAGNEGVKTQTVEAIHHAQIAKVPIVVFVNKMDLPVSNLKEVKKSLNDYNLEHPLLNNQVPFIAGSCLKKTGISQLLTTLCQIKKKMLLKVNFNCLVKAVVLDCKVTSLGIKTTIILQKGVLRLKTPIVVNNVVGRVKVIFDHLGKKLETAMPGMCVVVLGLDSSVETGSLLFSFPEFKFVSSLAKGLSSPLNESKSLIQSNPLQVNWQNLWKEEKTSKVVNFIVKLDTKGSEQVFWDQVPYFQKKVANKTELNFVHIGVGEINLSDFHLAKVSQSIVLTFNLKSSSPVLSQVLKAGLIFKNFTIFSHLFDYLEELKKGQKPTQLVEKIIGQAKVLKIFKHSKLGTIAGCIVQKGVIKMGEEKFKLIRDKKQIIADLKVKSLKCERESIKLAVLNQEFGIIFTNFSDLAVDDQLFQFTPVPFNEK